ncbi:MAG: UDP-N-acetylmuramoyl-L-alanine--D-glutamate ligase [Verrucomicrobiaceae bacterium]|nr:UDP-N-acetylmuramoyl-L-alanine--D-glutamate ligase [Verrucomicrobiaceae bacterium]
MKYKGQNVAVLGCGRSGQAAARLARREGALVTVFDDGDSAKVRSVAAKLREEGCVNCIGAEALEADVAGFDLVIISPGISLAQELAGRFTLAGISIIGEMEFAFPFCSARIVGVTGTNGKTTTVELIEKMLNACGEPTVAAGNYGPPLSEIVSASETYSTVALEISSFQLEAVEGFRPEVAVWTNFAPDHLDRYTDVEQYRAAKMRLFENQTNDDWAVLNLREGITGIEASTCTFSAFDDSADYHLDDNVIMVGAKELVRMDDMAMRGRHNAENVMAALAVGNIHGHSSDSLVAAIAAYSPPPHRCEPVGVVDGVSFINDSKATNLHALQSALVSLHEGKDIILIAGGKDKGLPFGDLGEYVAEYAEHVVLIGEVRETLARVWSDHVDCKTAASMQEAVSCAAALARPGQTVLFAPGTSSFDMFSGYEARGEAFCAAVNHLTQPTTPNE